MTDLKPEDRALIERTLNVACKGSSPILLSQAAIGKLLDAAREEGRRAPGEAAKGIDSATIHDLIITRLFGPFDRISDELDGKIMDAAIAIYEAIPTRDEAALPEPAWPATCDGVEQPAFEAWANSQRFDMTEHPLHYLFMDAKTDAARRAWKAGLIHAVDRMKAIPPQAQPVSELPDLTDAQFVHLNMLRGGIAKLTPAQIGHLYRGSEAIAVVAELKRQNAEAFAAQPSAEGGEHGG